MDLLIQTLSLERCLLDANGRELIFEAAFQVACADGIIQAKEDLMLRSIASRWGSVLES